MRDEELGGVRRKLFNGILGGSAGGLLGGVSFLLLQSIWAGILRGEHEDFWSASATGFVILGLCIGTFINGKRIAGPTPLASGDQIRLGSSVLRFGERQERVDATHTPSC